MGGGKYLLDMAYSSEKGRVIQVGGTSCVRRCVLMVGGMALWEEACPGERDNVTGGCVLVGGAVSPRKEVCL